MAERDVIFTGKFVADPSARPAMKEFGKDLEEAQKKIASATSATGKSIVDTEKKLADAAKKSNVEFDKLSQASVKRAEVEQRALEARLTNQKRKADAEAANIKKVIESANQQYQKAAGQIAQANQQLMDGTARVGEGVVKLGRGFAMMGIVGEKDTKKILETLIQVQAVVDLTRGAIDLYRGMSDAVKAYQAAVAAATAAETALAAARARTAAAGGAQAVGGVVPLGGARAAGAGLPAAGLGIGIGGTLSTLAIGALAVGGAAALRGNVGGSNDFLIERGNADPGTFYGALGRFKDASTISEFFGTKNFEGDGIAAIQNRALRDQRKANAAEKNREQFLRNLDADSQRVELELRSRDTAQAIRRRSSQFTGGLTEREAIEQQLQTQRRITLDSRNRLEEVRGSVDPSSAVGRRAILGAESEVSDNYERAIELSRQRLAIEERIRDTRKASGEAEVRLLQDAIALEEQRIRTAQDAIRSGEERLGRASQRERDRFVSLSQRALREGFTGFSGDELNQLERFGGESIVTGVKQEFRRRGGRAARESGGFRAEEQIRDQALLAQRQLQQQSEESQARNQEAEIFDTAQVANQQTNLLKLQQQQAEFNVNVTLDVEGISREAREQFERSIKASLVEVERRISQELKESLEREKAARRAANAGLN